METHRGRFSYWTVEPQHLVAQGAPRLRLRFFRDISQS